MKLSNIIRRDQVCYFILLIALVIIVTPIYSINAQITVGGSGSPSSVSTLVNPLDSKVKSIGDLVQSGLQVFTYIAVLIGVFMLVVVGLKYILARGKPEEMKKASQWLLYIVIGVAIVIGSKIAVSIVINTMSASGVINPNVIQSAEDALK